MLLKERIPALSNCWISRDRVLHALIFVLFSCSHLDFC